MSPALLLESIRVVHAGGRWTELQFSRDAVDRLLRRETGMRRIAGLLSPLAVDILRAVARGASNQRIADQFRVDEDALRVHLHAIYEKLGYVAARRSSATPRTTRGLTALRRARSGAARVVQS